MTSPESVDVIGRLIFMIRNRKAMLDSDLAVLYGVRAKQLNRAVKRNKARFPGDFLFQLNPQEYDALRLLRGVTGKGRHSKYLPFAFTEQGVAMLSSILRSHKAAMVNVAIMRAFVRFREILSRNKDLALKLGELERRLEGHDHQIQTLFESIRQLMQPPEAPRRRIGFQPP